MARLAWLSRIHPVTEAPGCGLTHRETEAIPKKEDGRGRGDDRGTVRGRDEFS